MHQAFCELQRFSASNVMPGWGAGHLRTSHHRGLLAVYGAAPPAGPGHPRPGMRSGAQWLLPVRPISRQRLLCLETGSGRGDHGASRGGAPRKPSCPVSGVHSRWTQPGWPVHRLRRTRPEESLARSNGLAFPLAAAVKWVVARFHKRPANLARDGQTRGVDTCVFLSANAHNFSTESPIRSESRSPAVM